MSLQIKPTTKFFNHTSFFFNFYSKEATNRKKRIIVISEKRSVVIQRVFARQTQLAPLQSPIALNSANVLLFSRACTIVLSQRTSPCVIGNDFDPHYVESIESSSCRGREGLNDP
ncbi:hypothetical protein AVEN_35302-1 [Araneus ventricosus]|uniref:Uncharacterized protein n=1 Tax=Araneus ventricosus TaxID=182803 RepID=A0A4Y2IL49_ARAVE|nr:hypothetical protein AVEN_35302-1 [Araneus ventricosus]